MEFHQLEYFVAVAESGSFTQAARRCGVAQPSLSQQVLKLERELGARLFDRLPRRVVPTDAGRRFYDSARALLASAQDAVRSVRDDQGGSVPRVSVGAIPTVAPYLLPQAVRRFLARVPSAELAVHEGLTPHVTSAVLAGELDLAVVALPVHDERLLYETVISEPLLAALPAGHPLAARRHVAPNEMRDQPFILLHEMHCLGEQTAAFCRENGLGQRITCRGAQVGTVQMLVGMGLGLSLLPAMAKTADADPARVYRPLRGRPLARTLVTIWHRDRYRTQAARQFAQAVRDAAAGPGGDANAK
jgi:LysR family hydrogen peroxide-inducible transcriptional activator